MGWGTRATTFFGAKISIIDLRAQITEENFSDINNYLTNARFIGCQVPDGEDSLEKCRFISLDDFQTKLDLYYPNRDAMSNNHVLFLLDKLCNVYRGGMPEHDWNKTASQNLDLTELKLPEIFQGLTGINTCIILDVYFG